MSRLTLPPSQRNCPPDELMAPKSGRSLHSTTTHVFFPLPPAGTSPGRQRHRGCRKDCIPRSQSLLFTLSVFVWKIGEAGKLQDKRGWLVIAHSTSRRMAARSTDAAQRPLLLRARVQAT